MRSQMVVGSTRQTSALSSSDRVFYMLIKSQEMVPFMTLGFLQSGFILKDAGSKAKYTEVIRRGQERLG